MTQAPIIFLIFNRPEETAHSFAAIRAVRPSKLLVVADGPRASRPGETELCERTRAIIDNIDWPCEVSKNFADANMGCGRRVASGISWAFEQVEGAIIIEDDCVPDPSFFRFCSELLDRYRDDPRVAMISGNNFQDGSHRTDDSYYFSQLPHCWGWATWRRAWASFDFYISSWPERRETAWLKQFAKSPLVEQVWRKEFDDVLDGKHDTWDFQWRYCMWERGALSIVPNVNLVANIGFGERATHTFEQDGRQTVPKAAISFPLVHPATVDACSEADDFERRHLFRLPRLAFLDDAHFWLLSAARTMRPILVRLGLWERLRALTKR